MLKRKSKPGAGSHFLTEAAWFTCHPNGRLRDTPERVNSGRGTVTIPVPQSKFREGWGTPPFTTPAEPCVHPEDPEEWLPWGCNLRSTQTEDDLSNIDDFNKAVGIVFSRLYKEFPRSVNIDYLEFILPMMGVKLDSDSEVEIEDIVTDMDLHEATPELKQAAILASEQTGQYAELFRETMHWLSAENFIRYEIEQITAFSGVVLTEKGLKSLSLVPAGLEASIGESLIKAVNEGAKDGIIKIAKLAICEWGPEVASRVISSMLKP